jgi:hypothetical protein
MITFTEKDLRSWLTSLAEFELAQPVPPLYIKRYMEASKTSAFLSGMVGSTIVQSCDLSFIVVALVLFPTVIVFVIGWEFWLKWGEAGGAALFLYGPEHKKAVTRMFMCGLGALITGTVIPAWTNI